MELNSAQVNDVVFQKLASGDQGDVNKVASAAQEYTRTKMREDGFARKVLPPIPITNADLDRSLTSDRNRVIVDKETDQDTDAMTVPYGTAPATRIIRCDRYEVTIQRTQTKKYYKDLSTFRTDRSDVRQILANNLTKDMLTEEDNKFIAVVNTICGVVGATTNVDLDQHVAIDDTTLGYPSREGFNDALKVLPRLSSRLQCSSILINSVMINDLQKWGRDEVGDDLAGDILINGWAETTIFGRRLIVTIKRDLVADNTMYMFAEPKFMGKFFTIQDATIHMERKDGVRIEFYAYKEDGMAIGNTLSVAKATFTVA